MKSLFRMCMSESIQMVTFYTASGDSQSQSILKYSKLIFRISLTLACPMDLRLYPLDKQVCVLQIASCKLSYDSIISLYVVSWWYCLLIWRLNIDTDDANMT